MSVGILRDLFLFHFVVNRTGCGTQWGENPIGVRDTLLAEISFSIQIYIYPGFRVPVVPTSFKHLKIIVDYERMYNAGKHVFMHAFMYASVRVRTSLLDIRNNAKPRSDAG